MKNTKIIILTAILAATFCGCDVNIGENSTTETTETTIETVAEVKNEYEYVQDLNIIDDNYRNYYEIFVYSFCDSDGDGIGDINGVTSKLDYIEEMGFGGIWLMPIMESTTYHKYDVVDYYNVDEQYGSNEDFLNFKAECDKRGINVIVDLVLNHTSDEHEWFTSACDSLRNGDFENKYIDYYNIVEGKPTGGGYYPIYGTDFYYEAVFWDKMPDLNLENENLRAEIEGIASYWLNEMGVDGFRLDAAKEFYTGDTAKNIEVLNWFCDYTKSVKPDAYNVAEVWSSFSSYTEYYESSLDSVFGFTLSQSSGKIAKTLNNSGFVDSAASFAEAQVIIDERIKSFNQDAIDAPFISNHDHDRSEGFLKHDERKIKAAAGMYLTMKGSPFVYYGEEIGLSGSGIDENKRAPMYWSEDNSSAGMCYGPPAMNPIKNNFTSVEEQLSDENSILNYYKRALRIRNENPEIARGDVEQIILTNMETAAVRRNYNGSEIIIVYNLSDKEMEIADEKLSLDTNKIRGYLTISTEETVILEDNTLKMPSYSIVVLKGE